MQDGTRRGGEGAGLVGGGGPPQRLSGALKSTRSKPHCGCVSALLWLVRNARLRTAPPAASVTRLGLSTYSMHVASRPAGSEYAVKTGTTIYWRNYVIRTSARRVFGFFMGA